MIGAQAARPGHREDDRSRLVLPGGKIVRIPGEWAAPWWQRGAEPRAAA